jgi:hypothetical protein
MRVFVTAPTPPTSTLVRPFTVSISDSEIDDVKQRLARTRWPDPETGGRLVARGSRRERQISGRLLGARLRLAALRVRAQSLPPIPDRD